MPPLPRRALAISAPRTRNVFPFLTPDGITVSKLAELARVRKQTMAQAVDQLERMAMSSEARTQATAGRGSSSLPSAAHRSRRSPTRPPRVLKSTGRS